MNAKIDPFLIGKTLRVVAADHNLNGNWLFFFFKIFASSQKLKISGCKMMFFLSLPYGGWCYKSRQD